MGSTLVPIELSEIDQRKSSPDCTAPLVEFASMNDSTALPQRNHPRALQKLSLYAFHSHLLALCQKRNYSDSKRSLKHYLKFQLPSLLRQQLLDLVLKDSRIYTLDDLYMFELLLSPTVRRVKVRNVRPFFRQSFAEMLQRLGTGVEVLVLEDSSWLQSRDILPLTLSRIPYLQHVSLRYLATDAMLASLSRHCVRLQEIDVSGSNDVTDQGMQALCQPSTMLDCEDTMKMPTCWCHEIPDQNQPVKKKSRKISAPARVNIAQWLPRLVQGIRRHSVVNRKSPAHQVHPRLDEESAAVLWPEDEEHLLELDISKTQRSCIQSLRRLRITGTKVTAAGVLQVLQSNPDIEIFNENFV